MSMSDCRTRGSKSGVAMTMARSRQRGRRVMLKLRLFFQSAWRWGVIALAVMLVIAASESGRTFASLVTDPQGRGEILLRTIRRAETVRPEHVTSNQAFYERELLRSIELGDVAYAESLLAAGISANATDPRGWTPLMLAARHNHLALVSVLCERGARLEARTGQGTTALMLAANNGHQDMVRLLLNRRAQVNAKTTSGWTTLMYAAWKGQAVIAADLLRAGADSTAIDSQQWTALMYAAWQGHAETVRVFLESPKIKTVSARERKLARALAARQGHVAIVDLLNQRARRG
jgi:ankyrin repeat protein